MKKIRFVSIEKSDKIKALTALHEFICGNISAGSYNLKLNEMKCNGRTMTPEKAMEIKEELINVYKKHVINLHETNLILEDPAAQVQALEKAASEIKEPREIDDFALFELQYFSEERKSRLPKLTTYFVLPFDFVIDQEGKRVDHVVIKLDSMKVTIATREYIKSAGLWGRGRGSQKRGGNKVYGEMYGMGGPSYFEGVAPVRDSKINWVY